MICEVATRVEWFRASGLRFSVSEEDIHWLTVCVCQNLVVMAVDWFTEQKQLTPCGVVQRAQTPNAFLNVRHCLATPGFLDLPEFTFGVLP